MPDPRFRQIERIEKGIARYSWGFRVAARVQGKLHRKTFPSSATVEEMRAWRARVRQRQRWERLGRISPVRKLRRGEGQWCYLYVIRRGEFVKIGRAVDPTKRYWTLQSGNPEQLELVAVAPIHGDLERVVHEKFADLSVSGEWFRLTNELADFVQRLKNGENPVSLVWDVLSDPAPSDVSQN